MVIWKNVNLATLGVIVDKTPTIDKAQKNIEVVEIEGRNGFLSIDKKCYKPFALSIQCHLNEDVADIDEVKELLDGYGTLSLDGQREYTAIINNSIPFSKVIGKYKSFIIQFMVNPIAHDIEATTVNITQTGQEFTISKGVATYPTITVKGDGNVNITINNSMFKLYDLDSSKTYLLDCENKVITANGVNASSQMQFDFPSLQKGTNRVDYTGTVTELKIEYKKAYL